MLKRLFILAVAATIGSLGNLSVALADWTKAEKDQSMKNCMFSAKGQYNDKAQGFCDCWQAKVIKESPEAIKQGRIPSQRTMEINAECKPK